MAALTETLKQYGVFTYPLDVPIDADARKELDHVLFLIEKNLWSDDGCDDDNCTDENPKCSQRELQIAKRKILSILDPVHRSLNPDRLSNPAEEIFLRRWQKENERKNYLNNGFGALELILTPTRIRNDHQKTICGRSYYVPPVSQRDAEVAATVIQWLGTNCGLSFMMEAEREVKAAKAERHDMEREKSMNIFEDGRVLPTDENLARGAAMYAFKADDPKYEPLVQVILAAMQSSAKMGNFVGAGI